MIRTPYSVLLPLLFSFFTYFQTCEEIQVDYPSHPYHPFDIEHAEIILDIEIDQNLVTGTVDYTIRSKNNQLTELQFHASKLSIDDVKINDRDIDFEVNDNLLTVQLTDTLNENDEINLLIRWQSTSDFGLHKSYDGSLWSSLNPLAHRHWLPGFDHPRESFTFNAGIDIPNDMEVLFNGELGETSPVSQSKKRVRWSSEKEVPATGLGFVVGNFQISEMTAGFTKIRLFHHQKDQLKAADLIVEAARLKRAVEDALSFEYPWESINIVLMQDNIWMERTHGTGTVYLFDRLGSLENQLARNVYSQWFGEYQRTEQYLNLENEGENGLLATALHYQFSDSSAFIENPDSLILIEDWNRWQVGYPLESNDYTSTIDKSLEGLMRSFKGIIDFDDYAEVWYQQTGIPNFNPQPIILNNQQADSMVSPTYQVSLILDEISSELSLAFNLIDGAGEERQTLTLFEHQFDAVTSQEISFNEQTDTVTLAVPATTEYVILETGSSGIVEIIESPLFYLLNQLRSENPANRVSAAKLLVQHSENPDLQLALTDILGFEENQEVMAAIYEALAFITNGAAGTEEQFINELNNSSEEIQRASIRALRNYPNNDYARSSLQSKLLRSEGEIFETTLQVYNQIATQSEVESTLRGIVRRDTVGLRTMRLIEVLDSLHTSENALQVADEFTIKENPYEIRKRALELLNLYDIDSERWNTRLNELLSDPDPRIRFWAVEHIPRFNSVAESIVLLNSAEVNEFDPRILLMIEGVKEELAQ